MISTNLPICIMKVRIIYHCTRTYFYIRSYMYIILASYGYLCHTNIVVYLE